MKGPHSEHNSMKPWEDIPDFGKGGGGVRVTVNHLNAVHLRHEVWGSRKKGGGGS